MDYSPFIWIAVQSLLPVIGFWVGVIVLRQVRSGATWWFLLSGVILMTIGIIATSVVFAQGPPGSLRAALALRMISIATTSAWILFAGSFAVHAFSVVRLAKRARELEGVCAAMSAAMSAEMQRLGSSTNER